MDECIVCDRITENSGVTANNQITADNQSDKNNACQNEKSKARPRTLEANPPVRIMSVEEAMAINAAREKRKEQGHTSSADEDK